MIIQSAFDSLSDRVESRPEESCIRIFFIVSLIVSDGNMYVEVGSDSNDEVTYVCDRVLAYDWLMATRRPWMAYRQPSAGGLRPAMGYCMSDFYVEQVMVGL